MKKTIPVISLCLAFLSMSPSLYSLTGDEILAKTEEVLSGPRDYEGRLTMTLANYDGSGKEERALKVWFAGKEKRVIKFLSPSSMNGIGLLSLDADEMYLYLPAQNKIRRIEGGVKNDDFQGTDFSYNEMGSYDYREDYTAGVDAEDETTYTLILKIKPDADKPYDKVMMIVDKSTFIPQTIEFYKDDTLKKILSILEIKKTGSNIVPSRIKMENVEKKHYTEMIMTEMKFDQGLLEKNIFSKRFLKKKAQ
ncbi:MAG: outer membrane lipoprotein-sorting protein [Spirochaetales bacterium]|nr:outer membrane lipoprotein-sorting protein [Spirochaetales bacterium]